MLYEDMRNRMSRVPKRRRQFVAYPLLEKIDEAYTYILCIEEDPIHGTSNAEKTRYDRIVKAEKSIMAVERQLWVWWNICEDRDEDGMKTQSWKQRAGLCERFNYVLRLLRKMQTESPKYDRNTDKEEGLRIQYYTESEITNAEFLSKLRTLHQMTHRKTIRLAEPVRAADARILIRLMDDAWFYAVHGNKMRLSVPKERNWRKNMFSRVISDLSKMQRPLFAVMSIGGYSNLEMKEWTELFNECRRLMIGVQRSDRGR